MVLGRERRVRGERVGFDEGVPEEDVGVGDLGEEKARVAQPFRR